MSKLSFPVKKNVYPAEILLKAAYSFIDHYYLHFDEDAHNWIVYISAKGSGQTPPEVQGQFENELISQTVRRNVYQRTHTVREILLARSMTTSIIDETDPLERIASDQMDVSDEELNDILTDWFEKNEK